MSQCHEHMLRHQICCQLQIALTPLLTPPPPDPSCIFQKSQKPKGSCTTKQQELLRIQRRDQNSTPPRGVRTLPTCGHPHLDAGLCPLSGRLTAHVLTSTPVRTHLTAPSLQIRPFFLLSLPDCSWGTTVRVASFATRDPLANTSATSLPRKQLRLSMCQVQQHGKHQGQSLVSSTHKFKEKNNNEEGGGFKCKAFGRATKANVISL